MNGDPAIPPESAIAELSGSELLQRTGSGSPPFFVLFYTPLCGTCKLALRMLEIVTAADAMLTIYRCNLNLSPQLAERWHIESVPCLAHLRSDNEVDKLYRMSSVGDLYAWMHERAPGN